MPGDGFAQEGIALFRAVAAEAAGLSHFLHGGMQGRGNGRHKRASHVPDAQTDDRQGGVGFPVRAYLGGHGGKQV